MGPQGVWQAWEAEVSRVLSSLGVRQRRVLALFSLGVALAKHCGLARVAAVVPGLALVPSITRRFERLLANRRLDVRAARGGTRADALAGAGRDPSGADRDRRSARDAGAPAGLPRARHPTRLGLLPAGRSASAIPGPDRSAHPRGRGADPVG